MYTPETSHLFEKHTDPESGVSYYVLSSHVATYQQSFYFVNPSMTNDGRYLWFYCCFPPVGIESAGRSLGVVDFLNDTITYFPDTMFSVASPYVDLTDGTIYWAYNDGIFCRTPNPDDKPEKIFQLPEDLHKNRHVIRMATHLSFSEDKQNIFLDMMLGNDFVLGSLDIKSGKFETWLEEKNAGFDHGQFNPKNKQLALIAKDFWANCVTGEKMTIPYDENGKYQRMWTLDSSGKTTCYYPPENYATHEWWSGDGEKIYYTNPPEGIRGINIKTGEHEKILDCLCWHAHSTKDSTLFTYDAVVYDTYSVWYRGCPSSVSFYNKNTNKKVTIVSRNPELYTPENQCRYHIDPHPQFTANEKHIAFTTTVRNTVDLALCPVNELIKRTL